MFLSYVGEALDALINILTAEYLDFDSLESDLNKLNLKAVTDEDFNNYLGNRTGCMTENYVNNRTNSESTSENSTSQSLTLSKERNTTASLANVADLKLLWCAFNEDDLCTLLADKLFDCDRGRLELHVSKFAQKMQKMRALFIRLKMSKSEGLTMGEMKVQKQFFHPFLNALIESEGRHASSTQLTLKIALEYKDVTTEITGKSDFAFSSADFVNGVDDVNSILEYKPPYGKMMSLSWAAWDQTVFQALQL